MGLDGVELLMEVEETFGIAVTDEEATTARTPRMLIELVLSKLRIVRETTCLSQKAFYLLRRALMDHVGAARRAIRPDTPLHELIDTDQAGQLWPNLSRTLAVPRWPELVRPRLLVAGIHALTGIALVATFVRTLPLSFQAAVILGLAAAIVVEVAAFYVTRPWRTHVPDDMASVRDVVPYAATSERIAQTREQVALIVKILVIEQFGLEEADYREDADFGRDLGMD